MSFIGATEQGKAYAPGWFLAHEECERQTRQIAASGAVTAANGGKYVKMGTFYPANNASTVEGIVYEDVDVTSGNMPGSVVTKGVVYLDRLPAAPASGVQSALEGKGFTFITTSPSVTRPDFGPKSLASITVASAEGAASGDTEITLSGYTPASGESYVYKTHATTAPVVGYNEKMDYTWTAWDGTSDITATDGYKITIASVNADGRAVAAGSATVDAKA